MTILTFTVIAAVFYFVGVFTSHWWRETAAPAIEGEVTTLRADLADLARKHGL